MVRSADLSRGQAYTILGSAALVMTLAIGIRQNLAWKVAVVIGLIAGTMQLLMNDRPTARMQALQTAAA